MGNSPMISLSAGDTNNYPIRDINYHTKTLTLIDDEVANQRCPRPRHNITSLAASPSFLSFPIVDTKLVFYFNCTSWRFASSRILMPCLQSGENQTYITHDINSGFEDSYQWFQDCDEKVETWVIRDEKNNINSAQDRDVGVVIGEAFGKGFLLDWKAPPDSNCFLCEHSGGRCGFPYSSDDPRYAPRTYFYCLCPDGSVDYDPYCRGNHSQHVISTKCSVRWIDNEKSSRPI